ncbi:hypothetical protein CCACVL1_24847 [Corchorus capsularis]|uniref:Uncharacterized protein n=1 Tax=Corchorus capsularis TaxID=210143 RepID=A0A1R3GMR4_COCAP|nr:hypothetical protein CCACVL1_24847 [Corchorus capsularis]
MGVCNTLQREGKIRRSFGLNRLRRLCKGGELLEEYFQVAIT